MRRDVFVLLNEVAQERDRLRSENWRLRHALNCTRAMLESSDELVDALVAQLDGHENASPARHLKAVAA